MDYHIGPGNKYKLSQQALAHIVSGDLTDRQDRSSGTTNLVKIIAGGLHTLGGWKTFLTYRPDIKHGLFFEPNTNEEWYYARELQNDVLLLRIPRSAFQSGAANLTKFPETYYKSGYLWKTLFPEKFDENAIVNSIDDALNNQDLEETNGDLIIGYFNKGDVFKALKIRIQLHGNKIVSAFPNMVTANDWQQWKTVLTHRCN